MLHPMTVYFWTHKLYKKPIGKIIVWFLFRLNRIIFSCEIAPSAVIDPSVLTPHNLLGCVIGEDVVIGGGTRILQNVTIGGRGGKPQMPVIGKNCLIGAGACVLGGVHIGDNVKIGCNAVVVNDIPSNATAVGIPAIVVKRSKLDE